MGVTEWCWTDYLEPQSQRAGWLEAVGWITCIDPVLTLRELTEDFTRPAVSCNELVGVAARHGLEWPPTDFDRDSLSHISMPRE